MSLFCRRAQAVFKGTLYVGSDFGVVQRQKNAPIWHMTAAGLPNVTVADLLRSGARRPLRRHARQGIWSLKVQ